MSILNNENSKLSHAKPVEQVTTQPRPSPQGKRRLHKFVKETRVLKGPPLVEFAILIFSMALILCIMYLNIMLVQSMSTSANGRTRFFTLMLTLSLPAIIYGVVQFFTRRATLAGMCGKTFLAVGLLSLVLSSSGIIGILWFTPACFGFSYLVTQLKDRWKNHKQGVILTPIKDKETDEEDRGAQSRYKGSSSRRQNSGWFNSYYSYFKMKRD